MGVNLEDATSVAGRWRSLEQIANIALVDQCSWQTSCSASRNRKTSV